MIGYLKGKVIYSDTGTIILETNGVGYEITCSGAAFAKLVTDGAGEVFTYLQVSENGIALYGFVSVEEKNMFLKLITVSGVGPKMGITVLSQMNIKELAVAIATSDVKLLSTVKGLGKKTAERIILELREKMGAAELTPTTSSTKAQPITATVSGIEEDAIVGLMSLGYTRAESTKAVKKAMEQGATSLEDIIMTALRNM